MASGRKCATWGEAHVFPTKHDPLNPKTLSFWFTAPPLVRVLKRKLGVPASPILGTPQMKANVELKTEVEVNSSALVQVPVPGQVQAQVPNQVQAQGRRPRHQEEVSVIVEVGCRW